MYTVLYIHFGVKEKKFDKVQPQAIRPHQNLLWSTLAFATRRFPWESKSVNFLKTGNQPIYAHQIPHTGSREDNLESELLTETRAYKPHNEGAGTELSSLSHILLPPGSNWLSRRACMIWRKKGQFRIWVASGS